MGDMGVLQGVRAAEGRPRRVIDAHLHFQPDNAHFDQLAETAGHRNDGPSLAGAYREAGICCGVVMGNRPLPDDAAHVYPPFLRYCAGVHEPALHAGSRAAWVDGARRRLQDPACVGLKLYAGYSSLPITDAAFEPYYDLAAGFGKPVAVHMGVTASPRALLKHCHPLQMDEIAVRHPDVTFVMCHFGNPWLMDAAAVLEKNANVYADLSGLLVGRVDVPGYFRRLSGYAHQLETWIRYVEDDAKFLFGTDWPLVNLGEYIDLIAALFPQESWDGVFYKNAARVYGLDAVETP